MSDNYCVIPVTADCDKISYVDVNKKLEHNNDMLIKFSITRTYRNGLGYPVDIVDRNNVTVTLPSDSHATYHRNELIVELTIRFTSDVNFNLNDPSNAERIPPAVAALKDALVAGKPQLTYRGREIVIEYSISDSKLKSTGYNSYFDDLDIAISRPGYNPKQTVHPYSNVGQNLIMEKLQNEKAFNYVVVINDIHNQFGERYVNINNRVFKVRRTVDYTLKPGVHLFVRDECSISNDFSNRSGAYFFSFEEADKAIPLWPTPALASSFGDALSQKQEELKTVEGEIKLETAKLNLSKTKLEQEAKAREFEYKERLMKLEAENVRLQDELNREKHERDRESQKMKYEYEKRSTERKDASEFMKWLPGLITAITGIVSIIVATQKAKSQ